MALSIVKIKKAYLLKIVAVTSFYFFSLFTSPILSMASTEQEGREHAEIRIVMSAAFVSESGVAIYDEIASYLGEKLNHKVDFISGFSFTYCVIA